MKTYNYSNIAAFMALAISTSLLNADATWKLPKETTSLKEGEGKAQIAAQCLLCHSADYISTQPLLTRQQWQATVEKMRVKYGAPIQTNAVSTLVDYLAANYGKPASASK